MENSLYFIKIWLPNLLPCGLPVLFKLGDLHERVLDWAEYLSLPTLPWSNSGYQRNLLASTFYRVSPSSFSKYGILNSRGWWKISWLCLHLAGLALSYVGCLFFWRCAICTNACWLELINKACLHNPDLDWSLEKYSGLNRSPGLSSCFLLIWLFKFQRLTENLLDLVIIYLT